MMVVFSALERLEGDGGRQAGHRKMIRVNRGENRWVNRCLNSSMIEVYQDFNEQFHFYYEDHCISNHY
jgi:hypothetical protein